MERMHSWVMEILKIRKIELWAKPYYSFESKKENDVELTNLAAELAIESRWDQGLILTSLRAHQNHALSFITVDKIYSSVAPTPHSVASLDEPPASEAWPHELFNTGTIQHDVDSAKFFMIDRSIRNWSAPEVAVLGLPQTCPDLTSTKCNPKDCANAKKLVECVECGQDCQNKRIQRGKLLCQDFLQVRHKCDKGLVLHTLVDIAAGTFVGEYVGELLSSKEYERRLAVLKPESGSFFGFQLYPNVIIDAREFGNKTRFISHSCMPNMIANYWLVKGERRVVFTAAAEITAGTELTIDYGEKAFAAIKCKQNPCKCNKLIRRKLVGVKSCKCLNCDRLFKSYRTMLNHQHKEHRPEEQLTCDICGNRFAGTHNLKEHNRLCRPADPNPVRKRRRQPKDKSNDPVKPKRPSIPVLKPNGERPRRQPVQEEIVAIDLDQPSVKSTLKVQRTKPVVIFAKKQKKGGAAFAATKKPKVDELKVGNLDTTFRLERDNGKIWVFDFKKERDYS